MSDAVRTRARLDRAEQAAVVAVHAVAAAARLCLDVLDRDGPVTVVNRHFVNAGPGWRLLAVRVWGQVGLAVLVNPGHWMAGLEFWPGSQVVIALGPVALGLFKELT